MGPSRGGGRRGSGEAHLVSDVSKKNDVVVVEGEKHGNY